MSLLERERCFLMPYPLLSAVAVIASIAASAVGKVPSSGAAMDADGEIGATEDAAMSDAVDGAAGAMEDSAMGATTGVATGATGAW